ncbi:MAG: DUF3084 domain-containing protein [Armatimonadetes bacterium]|nr:DUF3084 domain-containing protein [Armatimonadota bacterium]
MQIPLLFLVLGVLIPVSGFIAWAGDRIGHQVGKRRHTLFGFRPRHTAMIFTVGSGVGISLVSFLLLYFSSEGFRVVLEKGAQLLTVNKSLRQQNAALQSEVAERERQTQQARSEAGLALAGRANAQKILDATKKQSEIAQQNLAKKQDELRGAQNSLRDAESNLQEKQRAYSDTKNRLGVSMSEVAAARRNLIGAQTRFTTVQKRVSAAERATTQAVTDKNAAIAQREKIETSAKRTLDSSFAQSRELRQRIASERVAFEAEVAAKQAELKRLQGDIDVLQTRIAERSKELDASLSRTTALRNRQITYRVGEEIARLSVSSDQSVWRIESALEKFWKSAGKTAEKRGATASGETKYSPNGTDGSQAVVLAPRVISGEPTNAQTDSGTATDASLPSEDEVFRQLAQNIRRSQDPIVVVLRTYANAVVGEPVLVDMKTYRNPVVLAGGVKLGETIIEGAENATREQIADEVYDFLRRDVRRALLGAGVIPVASGEAEDGSSVVSLSGNEWGKIMDDLKRAKFRARVSVKTAKPIRAADPVSLAFEVKGLPSPSLVPVDNAANASGRVFP